MALSLHLRRRRLGVVLGVAVALAFGAVGAWRALPALSVEEWWTPSCGAAAPTPKAHFRLDAQTVVDGVERDRLTIAELVPIDRVGEPLLGSLLGALRPLAVEDLGLERLGDGGVVARHCRALVSGSQVTQALPLLTAGVGGAEALVPAELPVWRGDFDWWVSEPGELVGARFAVGGHPTDAWPGDGLHGQLFVQLWPADR